MWDHGMWDKTAMLRRRLVMGITTGMIINTGHIGTDPRARRASTVCGDTLRRETRV